jgi:hypothetical protein
MPTIHNHTVIPVDPRPGTSTVASESIGDFAARLVGLPGKLANIDHFNDLVRDYGVAHGLDYGTAVKHVKVHAYAWADDYKGGNKFVYDLRSKMHRGWTENQTKAILNCMRADPAGDRPDSPNKGNGGGWQSQPREEHVIWSGGTLPSLDDAAWDHIFNPDGEEIHVSETKAKRQHIWTDNGDGSVALVQPTDGKWTDFIFISYSPEEVDLTRKRISTFGWEKMGMIKPDSREVRLKKAYGPGTTAYKVFEAVAKNVATPLSTPAPAPAPAPEPAPRPDLDKLAEEMVERIEGEVESAEPEATPETAPKLSPAEIRAAIAARKAL